MVTKEFCKPNFTHKACVNLWYVFFQALFSSVAYWTTSLSQMTLRSHLLDKSTMARFESRSLAQNVNIVANWSHALLISAENSVFMNKHLMLLKYAATVLYMVLQLPAFYWFKVWPFTITSTHYGYILFPFASLVFWVKFFMS